MCYFTPEHTLMWGGRERLNKPHLAHVSGAFVGLYDGHSSPYGYLLCESLNSGQCWARMGVGRRKRFLSPTRLPPWSSKIFILTLTWPQYSTFCHWGCRIRSSGYTYDMWLHSSLLDPLSKPHFGIMDSVVELTGEFSTLREEGRWSDVGEEH